MNLVSLTQLSYYSFLSVQLRLSTTSASSFIPSNPLVVREYEGAIFLTNHGRIRSAIGTNIWSRICDYICACPKITANR
jgi:hypothetical protein